MHDSFQSYTNDMFCREAKMTVKNYIAQVGGLMGLCLGFSLLSAIELFYWFTFRLFSNM